VANYVKAEASGHKLAGAEDPKANMWSITVIKT
jgi:hypothetical protein